MGDAIGEFLPMAVGVAISPIPIIAVILLLFGSRARRDGLAFLIGWILATGVVLALFPCAIAGAYCSKSLGWRVSDEACSDRSPEHLARRSPARCRCAHHGTAGHGDHRRAGARGRAVSQDTIDHYDVVLRHEKQGLMKPGHVFLRSQFTPQALQDFLDAYPGSNGTRRKAQAALRQFGAFLVRRGVFAVDPTRDLKAPAAALPRERYLDTPEAKALADALIRYAGFPSDQVILLASDQPPQRQPTRGEILLRLSNLRGAAPKDGLLLVSFAGHGIERNGQAYLLPSDARIHGDVRLLQDTSISVTRMREARGLRNGKCAVR